MPCPACSPTTTGGSRYRPRARPAPGRARDDCGGAPGRGSGEPGVSRRTPATARQPPRPQVRRTFCSPCTECSRSRLISEHFPDVIVSEWSRPERHRPPRASSSTPTRPPMVDAPPMPPSPAPLRSATSRHLSTNLQMSIIWLRLGTPGACPPSGPQIETDHRSWPGK